METLDPSYIAFLHHKTQTLVLITLSPRPPTGASVQVSIRSEQGIERSIADRMIRNWMKWFDDLFAGEQRPVPAGWEFVDPMPHLEHFH